MLSTNQWSVTLMGAFLDNIAVTGAILAIAVEGSNDY
jgi:hypothetical protein